MRRSSSFFTEISLGRYRYRYRNRYRSAAMLRYRPTRLRLRVSIAIPIPIATGSLRSNLSRPLHSHFDGRPRRQDLVHRALLGVAAEPRDLLVGELPAHPDPRA